MTTLKTRLTTGIRRGPNALDTAVAAITAVTFGGLSARDFILGTGGYLAFTEAAVAVWALSYIHERRKRRQAEAQLIASQQEHPPTPTP